MRCWCRPHFRSELLRRCVAVLVAAGLFTGPPPRSQAAPAPEEYAVIASADITANGLSVSELRRIFLLERRFWKAGKPVVTLMPASGTHLRKFLLSRVCGMDESRFRHLLLEKMYRGELDLAPKTVESSEGALAFVAASSGLVAIVPAPLAASAHARVLAIGGKLPGAAGYPLKD